MTTKIVYTKFHEVDIQTTVTNDSDAVEQWIKELECSSNMKTDRPLNIGLDTKWTLLDEHQPENPIAILQLCVEHKCLIFQLCLSCKVPGSLITFLDNPNYTFTGVEIKKHFDKLAYKKTLLQRNRDFFESKIVDLRELAVEKGYFDNIERACMAKLAKEVLGEILEKNEEARTSIWHKILSDEQVTYASIDAYLSFEIGRALLDE